MELIPTKHKEKIPKGFSYPIGAKDLSEGLKGVPQYINFELWYRVKDTFWASKYHEKVKAKEPIRVIQVEYYRSRVNRSTPKDWEESGHCDPKWTIRVYGLPSEYRAETKKQIIANALPKIREWLIQIGNKDDFSYQQKTFAMDLNTRKLINN